MNNNDPFLPWIRKPTKGEKEKERRRNENETIDELSVLGSPDIDQIGSQKPSKCTILEWTISKIQRIRERQLLEGAGGVNALLAIQFMQQVWDCIFLKLDSQGNIMPISNIPDSFRFLLGKINIREIFEDQVCQSLNTRSWNSRIISSQVNNEEMEIFPVMRGPDLIVCLKKVVKEEKGKSTQGFVIRVVYGYSSGNDCSCYFKIQKIDYSTVTNEVLKNYLKELSETLVYPYDDITRLFPNFPLDDGRKHSDTMSSVLYIQNCEVQCTFRCSLWGEFKNITVTVNDDDIPVKRETAQNNCQFNSGENASPDSIFNQVFSTLTTDYYSISDEAPVNVLPETQQSSNHELMNL